MKEFGQLPDTPCNQFLSKGNRRKRLTRYSVLPPLSYSAQEYTVYEPANKHHHPCWWLFRRWGTLPDPFRDANNRSCIQDYILKRVLLLGLWPRIGLAPSFSEILACLDPVLDSLATLRLLSLKTSV